MDDILEFTKFCFLNVLEVKAVTLQCWYQA